MRSAVCRRQNQSLFHIHSIEASTLPGRNDSARRCVICLECSINRSTLTFSQATRPIQRVCGIPSFRLPVFRVVNHFYDAKASARSLLVTLSSVASRQTWVNRPRRFIANTLIGGTHNVLRIHDIQVSLQNIIYIHDFSHTFSDCLIWDKWAL